MKLRSVRRILLAAALLLSVTTAAFAELPPLIPRETLFGNPERTSPKLSPDTLVCAGLMAKLQAVGQTAVHTLLANSPT